MEKLTVEKDGDERTTLEHEESPKSVSLNSPPPSEGCEGGTGVGSLSRLGKWARREFAAILDEFWEHLFELHGRASEEAKAKKFDNLFGQNPVATATLNVEASVFVPSIAERGSEFLANPNYMDQLSHAMSQKPLNRFATSVPPTSTQNPAVFRNNVDQLSYHAMPQKPLNRFTYVPPASMQNLAVCRNNGLNAEQSYYDVPYSSGFVQNLGSLASMNKLYHSLPSIPGLAHPLQGSYGTDKSSQWDSYEPSYYSDSGFMAGVPLAYNQLPLSNPPIQSFPGHLSLESATKSPWSLQPFEQPFGTSRILRSMGIELENKSSSVTPETSSHSEPEALLLQLFKSSMAKLLELKGSEWLFSLNGGVDEELINLVAARERCYAEAETGELNLGNETTKSPRQYLSSGSDRKFGLGLKNNETSFSQDLFSTVPNCGESCIWRKDLILSFAVWCIRRILELALVEKRPELWGKYTYVLNRLQGILEPAFAKPRAPMPPCICLQIPVTQTKRLSSLPEDGGLPPEAAKSGMGKCTTASTIIDIIDDVKIAVSNRRGKAGTAAGRVAFPLGKRNLLPAIKRYKHCLSNMMLQTHGGGGGSGVCEP